MESLDRHDPRAWLQPRHQEPHVVEDDHGDPETLLNDLTKAEASVESLRAELEAMLSEAPA